MERARVNMASRKHGCSLHSPVERCRSCGIRGQTMADTLSDAELDRLDAIMVTRFFSAGETIIGQGEAGNEFYTVFDGVVRLVKLLADGRRAIVAFLYPGDFFGFSPGPEYPYSAEAVGRVNLCCFAKTDLGKLFREIPKLERGLLGLLSEKLVSSQEKMADLARKSPRERVAAFLLDLARQAPAGRGPKTFTAPMSREDMSDFLGLTIETISRTLTAFARENIIRIERRTQISILDMDHLKSIAEGGI